MASHTCNRQLLTGLFSILSIVWLNLVISSHGQTVEEIFAQNDPPFVQIPKMYDKIENCNCIKQFSVQYPFYGRMFSSIIVYANGYVIMGQDNERRYRKFPLPYALPESDKPLIAALLYPVNNEPTSPGNISYRELPEAHATLDAYDTEIRQYAIGSRGYKSKNGFEVIWNQLAEQDAADTTKTNTFRLTVLTDEVKTYVILQYYTIQNLAKGAISAAAGFNAGMEQGWYPLPLSGDVDQMTKLVNMGSHIPGRFYYEISTENILRGGCVKPEFEASMELQAYPHTVSSFGRDMIEISGLCLEQGITQSVMCRFDGKDEEPAIVSTGVHCITPYFMKVGDVKVEVSYDGGATYYSNPTHIHVGLPTEDTFPVTLVDRQNWSERQPGFPLELKWNTLAFAETSTVNIYVYGYREHPTFNRGAEWVELATISANSPNDGMHIFEANSVQCSNQNCHLYDMGAIVIRESTLQSSYLWSTLTMVSWLTNRGLSANGAQQKCLKWVNQDKQDSSWLNDLPVCPCELKQAKVDIGRWEPDVSCNENDPDPKKCRFHVGAQHCVRSVQPNAKGAGNQCCYNSAGLLMYSMDSYNGSTPDRAASFGKYPYEKPPYLPRLSHWIRDVVSYYHCCLYSDNCLQYMTLRPTTSCKSYASPKAATVFGDPHFVQFDGRRITFNGKGEFWLLKPVAGAPNGLKIQARLQQMLIDASTNTPATVVTAIAMQYGDTDKVEVRLAPIGWETSRKISVWVNKNGIWEQHFFTQPGQLYQKFESFNINRLRPADVSEFVLTFAEGIGIKITRSNNLLNALVTIPEQFKTKTEGLLGTWMSAEPAKYGQTFENTQTIYDEFRNQWRIQETESLFKYSDGETFLKFNDDTQYTPQFDNIDMVTNATVADTCGNNEPCAFDLKATGSEAIAIATKQYSESFDSQQASIVPKTYCGLLNIPHSVKDNNNYSVQALVTINGCHKGFKSVGNTQQYRCELINGQAIWTPAIGITCEAILTAGSSTSGEAGLIVGILIAVLIVVAVVGVLIFFFLRHKKEMKNQKSGEDKTETTMTDLQKKEDVEEGMAASRDDIVSPNEQQAQFTGGTDQGFDNIAGPPRTEPAILPVNPSINPTDAEDVPRKSSMV
ncbi:sushi domain-containing protein 2-like [Tubulanus polymorphus]|uniref:sushi domain-containing protein 2-like n=1 Tax=Tubulanus polymorphus TaxID=672921 RepID=UPI003DA277C8